MNEGRERYKQTTLKERDEEEQSKKKKKGADGKMKGEEKPTSSTSMINQICVATNPLQHILITLHLLAGRHLLQHHPAPRRDLPNTSKSLDRNLLIGLLSQPIRINLRRDVRVRAADRDAPARDGRQQRNAVGNEVVRG